LTIAAILATSIFFIPQALAALTSVQVVTNIGIVTTQSKNINDALSTLPVSPSSSQLASMSTTVVNGFQAIISSLANDDTAMQTTPPFTVQSDCDAVVAALSTVSSFVQIHQTLLSTVIGKHTIFAQFGATAPITAVLRTLEGAIDSFAYGLIALIPCGRPP
ncbi:hypothetical protein B0H17DRAFT_1225485, partial [Mycena rosella]